MCSLADREFAGHHLMTISVANYGILVRISLRLQGHFTYLIRMLSMILGPIALFKNEDIHAAAQLGLIS